MTRPHWSHSSLSQFLRCPRQFFFQRVLGLPRPTVPSGMLLGSAVHASLAEVHRGLRDRGDFDPHAVADALVRTWDAEEGELKVLYRSGESRDILLEQAIALVDLALANPPEGTVLDVEHRVTVPLFDSAGEMLPVPLVAVFDLVTAVPREKEDGAEDEAPPDVVVHEFKTTARKWSTSEAAASLQPTCYAHAAHEWYGGTEADGPRVEFRLLVKTKTPRLQTLPAGRDGTDFGRLGDLARVIGRAVRAGTFYPVESPFNCSGCAWRRECRELPLDPRGGREAENAERETEGGDAAC